MLNIYAYLFMLCVKPRTSMLKTNPFFRFDWIFIVIDILEQDLPIETGNFFLLFLIVVDFLTDFAH